MWRGGIAAALMLAGCAGEGHEPTPLPPEAAPSPRPTTAQPATVPAPRWHSARVRADAPSTPERATAVLPGDTMATVAERAGASVGALAAANHVAPPYTLAPGQRLIVPAGRWHVVRAGETGIAIARAYGAAWPRVIRANGLTPPYALEIGDRLLIPVPPPRPSARFTVPPRAKAAEPAATPSIPTPATVEARAQAYNLDIDKLLRGEPQMRRVRPVRPRPPPSASPPPSPAGEEGPSSPAGEGARSAEGVGTEPIAAAIHLEWPLTGRILSAFGPKPGGRFNDGINIASAAGAPVHAAADGVVAYAGNGVAAFGGLILLRHAGGWLTAYAHCEALLVAKGDTVRAGQAIARAGATGEVDEPQLHFEVRRGRTPVDPVRLLPGRGNK